MEKFFTTPSDEHAGDQVEKTAVQSCVEQRRVPDKVVNSRRLQNAPQQEKHHQRQQYFKEHRGKRQSENHHYRKQTHQKFLTL